MSNTIVATEQYKLYGTRVAVLGDSLTQQHNLYGLSWLGQITEKYKQSGASVEFINCAVDGHTFHRAINYAEYNGTTALQRVIDCNPDIVLILLGFNDLANGPESDNRTLAQVISDATYTVNHLKEQLPNVKIIWGAVKPYDTNIATSSLKNKSVYPYKMALPTTGIYSGCYSDNMLGDSVSTATQTCMANWKSFYDNQQALFDDVFNIDYWKIIRLGCGASDGLHLGEMGVNLFGSYVMKGLTAYDSVKFPKVTDQYGPFSDPDTLFSGCLTASGDGYINATPFPSDYKVIFDQYEKEMNLDMWHFPWKAQHRVTTVVNGGSSGRHFVVNIDRAMPWQTVYHSINGGAWSDTSEYTNATGSCNIVADSKSIKDFFVTGSNTILHKVGNCVYPPKTFTYSYTADSSVTVNLAGSDVDGLLPLAHGGTGTATPSIVAGSGVTVTGTWPNQTIAATGNIPSGGTSGQALVKNSATNYDTGWASITSLSSQNDFTKTQRITGIQIPTSGVGLELAYQSSDTTSYIASYNRSSASPMPMKLLCSTLDLGPCPTHEHPPTSDSTYKSATTYWVTNAISGKQATLVSGTNIKTINGSTILGSGNIVLNTYKTFGGSSGTFSGAQCTITFPSSFTSSDSFGVTATCVAGYVATIVAITASSVTFKTTNISTGVDEAAAFRWVAVGT